MVAHVLNVAVRRSRWPHDPSLQLAPSAGGMLFNICLIWKEAFLASKLDAELNSKDTRKVEFRLREQIGGFGSFSCNSSYIDVCPA